MKVNKENTVQTINATWDQSEPDTIHFTNRLTPDKECFIELAEKTSWKIPEGMKILEIGPGYGYMAKWLMETFNPESYTILDSKHSIDIPRSILGESSNIKYFTNEEYEKIFDEEYDLLVSIQCLTEVPKLYAESILFNIDCKRFFIIDTPHPSRGELWNVSEFYNHFTSKYQQISSGYYPNNFAFLGKKI